MKLLITIAFWVAAAALVGWLIVRHRGRVVMLADHRLPRRLVWMTALLLVALGIGDAAEAQRQPPHRAPTPASPDHEPAEPRFQPPGDAAYPQKPTHPFDREAAEALAMARRPLSALKRLAVLVETTGALNEDQRARLRSLQTAADAGRDAAWVGALSTLATTVAVRAGVDAAEQAPPSAAELVALLNRAETAGVYDGWLVGYLWRQAPSVGDAESAKHLALLHGRLESHARMVVAITRTRAELGPVVFAPWRSKAAPPKGYQALQIPPGFVERVGRHYPRAAAGEWNEEASVRLTLETRGEATLIRRGQRIGLGDGDPLTFRRLDMIEAPADAPLVLHQRQTGLTVVIPSGRTIGPRELPRFLDDPSRETIDAWVEAARTGQREAAVKLEWTLPLAHEAIRGALDGAGEGGDEPAGPLPTLLMLYDR